MIPLLYQPGRRRGRPVRGAACAVTVPGRRRPNVCGSRVLATARMLSWLTLGRLGAEAGIASVRR